MIARALVFLFVASAVVANTWDDYNDPSSFGEIYNFKFGALPEQATLPVVPWTDTYWPSQESGIAHRWNSRTPEDFKYKLYTQDELKNLTATELKKLSPAEKYDIFMGRFDYPIVRSEWLRTSPTNAGWEGLCHGWAPAAGFYTEPSPMSFKTESGIVLEFGSADVKALLTYFNAEYVHTNSYFLSQRCEYDLDSMPEKGDVPECADMHAATLHLVLTNQIGGNISKFFVADVDRGYAVWNQPVHKYVYQVISNRNATNSSAPGTVREVRINTVMHYARESSPRWESHKNDPVTYRKYYDYWLELDANDTIVGGSWESTERSDFAWKNALPPFSGYFKNLARLYALSTGQPDPVNVTNPIVTPLLFKSKHSVHTERVGSFSVENYVASHEQSWTIAPRGAKTIAITFPKFSTEHNFDKVKVYEGLDGQGALLAVLHGERSSKTYKFDAAAVHVTFVADRNGGGDGFRAVYKGL